MAAKPKRFFPLKSMTHPSKFLLVLLVVLAGCTKYIPRTQIEDTPENRDVIAFVEEYRLALEARNVRRILDLTSPLYFHDQGNNDASDDIDYDGLAEQLQGWNETLTDVRYNIRYRRITWEEDQVSVEYQFTGNFKLRTADGEEQWSRRLGDNRIVLARQEDQSPPFLILSGL